MKISFKNPNLDLNTAKNVAKAIKTKTNIEIARGVTIDASGTMNILGLGKIYKGSDFVIPEFGFYDPGMKNIGTNGRTHGGKGFIKHGF